MIQDFHNIHLTTMTTHILDRNKAYQKRDYSKNFIKGYFLFEGIKFEGEYRFGNEPYKGGFDKCLAIFNGCNKSGKIYNAHMFFGDDKFEIVSVKEIPDYLELKIEPGYLSANRFGLNLEENYKYIQFYDY